MSNIHEITLAGFDGDSDETDHLVVWVAGSKAEVRAVVEGTEATYCGPVSGATPQDADFTLPKDREALASRIAEHDAGIAPASSKP